MDLTGDGLFTISDIWALVELLWALAITIFFLPANLILMAMYKFAPGLVTFLELSPSYEYTMSWGTGITSGIIWLIGYALIQGALEDREIRQTEAEQARRKAEREDRQRREAEYDDDENPWSS